MTVHIRRIREKIEEDPSQPRIIETVWGMGYRLRRRRDGDRAYRGGMTRNVLEGVTEATVR